MPWDWILGISTLLVNSGLGWTKGAWWMWGIHAMNALGWQVYTVHMELWGLTVLNVTTIIIDIISGYRAWRKR